MNEKKIVVIGAGISGLLCGKRLAEAGHSVLILDKGRNIGGRLSTRRTDGAVFHHGASSLPDFYSHKELPEFGLEIFKRAEKEKIIQRKENLFEPINSVADLVNYCGTNLNTRKSCEAISINLNNKTIVVEVTRKFKHPFYEKVIKRSKKYHAHDEKNKFKEGEEVSIIESKPYSKKKTWQVMDK